MPSDSDTKAPAADAGDEEMVDAVIGAWESYDYARTEDCATERRRETTDAYHAARTALLDRMATMRRGRHDYYVSLCNDIASALGEHWARALPGTEMVDAVRSVVSTLATLRERERDEARAERDFYRTDSCQMQASRDAAIREADRWRHGVPIEGDYVCPDSLRADAAEKRAAEAEATIASVVHVTREYYQDGDTIADTVTVIVDALGHARAALSLSAQAVPRG